MANVVNTRVARRLPPGLARQGGREVMHGAMYRATDFTGDPDKVWLALRFLEERYWQTFCTPLPEALRAEVTAGVAPRSGVRALREEGGAAGSSGSSGSSGTSGGGAEQRAGSLPPPSTAMPWRADRHAMGSGKRGRASAADAADAALCTPANSVGGRGTSAAHPLGRVPAVHAMFINDDCSGVLTVPGMAGALRGMCAHKRFVGWVLTFVTAKEIHANAMLFDRCAGRVVRYEPRGVVASYNHDRLDTLLQGWIAENLPPGTSYQGPPAWQSPAGPQLVECHAALWNRARLPKEGPCTMWSLLLLDTALQHPDLEPAEWDRLLLAGPLQPTVTIHAYGRFLESVLDPATASEVLEDIRRGGTRPEDAPKLAMPAAGAVATSACPLRRRKGPDQPQAPPPPAQPASAPPRV